jgi:DNA polymerase III epsilon subunit-like protein
MIFWDTETTGLLRPQAVDVGLQPFITELYCVKVDAEFNFIDEIDTFLKPPVPITEEITKITGIDDAMVRNAPSFIQIYDKLCDFFLGERILIAHNNSFDTWVLKGELERHELEFQFPYPCRQICTVEASFPIENKRLTLGKLHEIATGRPLETSHRAKDDTFALIRCAQWLWEKGLIND